MRLPRPKSAATEPPDNEREREVDRSSDPDRHGPLHGAALLSRSREHEVEHPGEHGEDYHQLDADQDEAHADHGAESYGGISE
jgi:hypothetical protein